MLDGREVDVGIRVGVLVGRDVDVGALETIGVGVLVGVFDGRGVAVGDGMIRHPGTSAQQRYEVELNKDNSVPPQVCVLRRQDTPPELLQVGGGVGILVGVLVGRVVAVGALETMGVGVRVGVGLASKRQP